MSIKKYTLNNTLVAFMVSINRDFNGKLARRKAFFIKHYPTQKAALQAAKDYEKTETIKVNRAPRPDLVTADNLVRGLRLTSERSGVPYLKLQTRYRGVKITRWRSLVAHEWEDAFEELIKELLVFRQVPLTHELAMQIKKAKPKYDPSRKSNWKAPAFRWETNIDV